jgi:homeobox-leucine zipper protein
MHSTRAMEEEGVGKSWLALGIGGGDLMKRNNRPPVQFDLLFPPQSVKEEGAASKKAEKGGGRKRLKVVTADEDGRQSPHGGPGPSDGSGAGARKKLRLTNEQSTLLEDTFRAHNILSNVCIHILSPSMVSIPSRIEARSCASRNPHPCIY